MEYATIRLSYGYMPSGATVARVWHEAEHELLRKAVPITRVPVLRGGVSYFSGLAWVDG